MDWKYLFLSYDGRISRNSFWIGTVVLIGISLIGAAVSAVLLGRTPRAADLSHLIDLVLLFPALAVAAKRWHDRDKSGWCSLIMLIPVVGWMWCLVECGGLRGTLGPNRFG